MPIAEGAEGAAAPRAQSALVGIASVLALLMFLKFVVAKPIVFLLLGLLFGAAAFLLYRRATAGRWLLALLCLATTVVFGAHLFDKGFDAGAYQNNADYVLVLFGFPLALAGLVISALSIRGTTATTDG